MRVYTTVPRPVGRTSLGFHTSRHAPQGSVAALVEHYNVLPSATKLMNAAAGDGYGFSELFEPINMRREITVPLRNIIENREWRHWWVT